MEGLKSEIQKGESKVRIRWNWIVAALVISVLFMTPAPASAQEKSGVASWLPYGKPLPDLKGPAPKLANGKPSMAGVWSQTRRADVTAKNIPGFVPALPFTPWGERQWKNYDTNKQGDYAGSCLPFGMSRTIFGPHPIEFIQDENRLVLLAEQNTWFHQIYTDGRPHDPDLPPTWWGDSIGHYEGDTLVVETTNISGYVKIDTIGHPLSSKAKFTQTFKRVNFGTIQHTFTIDDPKTYTKPFTITNTWALEPIKDTKLLEYSCEEGNIEYLSLGIIKLWHAPEGDDAP